jgi:hypothetical protein
MTDRKEDEEDCSCFYSLEEVEEEALGWERKSWSLDLCWNVTGGEDGKERIGWEDGQK